MFTTSYSSSKAHTHARARNIHKCNMSSPKSYNIILVTVSLICFCGAVVSAVASYATDSGSIPDGY